MIQSYTTCNLLLKLMYKYKDLHKDIFVDRHKQSDVVEDQKNIPQNMKKLKFYIVKFNENGAMKPKLYLTTCVIRQMNC